MIQERKSKIKLISEMIAIYQTTVLNETDSDNIRLIKQDITNKKMDLEELKQELNSELNTLYDSGANEIDPEVNQLQIIINDVNNLLEDIIPDILAYVQSPNLQTPKKVDEKESIQEEIIIPKPVKEIKVEPINQTKEENVVKIEPIEDEEEIQLFDKILLKNDTQQGEPNEKIVLDVVTEEIKVEENRNEDVFLENIEREEIDNKNEVVFTENIKNEDIEKTIKVANKIDEIPEKAEIKNIVEQKNTYNEVSLKYELVNTIKLKQPTEDYRNTASNIVSSRIKTIDSPENAIKKAYNAAELVMSNIIETLSETKN